MTWLAEDVQPTSLKFQLPQGKEKHVRLDEPPQDERPKCFDCTCSGDMVQVSVSNMYNFISFLHSSQGSTLLIFVFRYVCYVLC